MFNLITSSSAFEQYMINTNLINFSESLHIYSYPLFLALMLDSTTIPKEMSGVRIENFFLLSLPFLLKVRGTKLSTVVHL